MYEIRVLLGGNIYVIRKSDKVCMLYKADGTMFAGNKNKLELEPETIRQMVRDAENKWFMEQFLS